MDPTLLEDAQLTEEEMQKLIEERQSNLVDMGPIADWYHEYIADLIYQSQRKDKHYDAERMVYLFKDPKTSQEEFVKIAHAVDGFEQFENMVATMGYNTIEDRKRLYQLMSHDMQMGDGLSELLEAVQERDVFRADELDPSEIEDQDTQAPLECEQ